jgi:hypothetical protein
MAGERSKLSDKLDAPSWPERTTISPTSHRYFRHSIGKKPPAFSGEIFMDFHVKRPFKKSLLL